VIEFSGAAIIGVRAITTDLNTPGLKTQDWNLMDQVAQGGIAKMKDYAPLFILPVTNCIRRNSPC